MSKPEHGVAAVVTGELERTPTPENSGAGPASQLDLLGNPDAETPVGKAIAKRMGAGRPAGAQNRVTRDIRRLILSRFKHPLIALAEIYSMPTEDLATELGCKKVEALDRQIRAASDLAPYLAAKQAAVDDAGETAMPTLHINFGSSGGAPVQGDGKRVLSIEAVALRHLQNQGLSGDDAEGSHDMGSHEDSQDIEDADELEP